MRRPWFAVVLGFWLPAAPAACSGAQAPVPEAACQSFQFRACKHACGRGVQQCVSGSWGPCTCVIDDAGFPGDAATESEAGGSDAEADVEASALVDAEDAPADGDAATDAGLLD